MCENRGLRKIEGVEYRKMKGRECSIVLNMWIRGVTGCKRCALRLVISGCIKSMGVVLL